jgi:hypothetical protein
VRFESVGEEIDSTPNLKLELSLPLSEDGTCKGEDEYDGIRLGVVYAKSTRTPNLGSRDTNTVIMFRKMLIEFEIGLEVKSSELPKAKISSIRP